MRHRDVQRQRQVVFSQETTMMEARASATLPGLGGVVRRGAQDVAVITATPQRILRLVQAPAGRTAAARPGCRATRTDLQHPHGAPGAGDRARITTRSPHRRAQWISGDLAGSSLNARCQGLSPAPPPRWRR